jgi:hypothetical protein
LAQHVQHHVGRPQRRARDQAQREDAHYRIGRCKLRIKQGKEAPASDGQKIQCVALAMAALRAARSPLASRAAILGAMALPTA